MLVEQIDGIPAIGLQQGVAERRTGRSHAGSRILVGRACVAVLVWKNLAFEPELQEEIALDPPMKISFAIKIRGALPWSDRSQVRRPQRRDLPLIDRHIGNSEQAHFSVRPWLNAGPFDRVIEIARFPRRRKIEIAWGISGAANIDGDHRIPVADPPLGIGVFPTQETTR